MLEDHESLKKHIEVLPTAEELETFKKRYVTVSLISKKKI